MTSSPRPLRELVLEVDPAAGRRSGVEAALRRAIRDGRVRSGDALPSSRTLAADLGVSRATVVAAYEQLAAEGFVTGEAGRATRVTWAGAPNEVVDTSNPLAPEFAHDFHPGRPDLSSFPRRAWQRSVRRVLVETPDDMLGYPHPSGVVELRRALADYLSRTRSLDTDADSIMVVGGFAAALALLGEHFARRGHGRIAVEDPMLFLHRDILRIGGVEIVPVEVDEDGLDVDRLAAVDQPIDAVLVCPAHQYPTGVTMSPDRRTALVDWARRHDAWVIEDDYDGEFRYDGRPVGALQGLAPDRVIHVGTASKMLGPGLRLAWMTVPVRLRRSLSITLHVRAGVSAIEQHVLADLFERGAVDRHVRTMRLRYRARRDLVAARLRVFDWLEVPERASGLNLCVRLTGDAGSLRDAEIARACHRRSVNVVELSRHFVDEARAPQGLVLGFGAPSEHQFPSALDALVAALADVAPTNGAVRCSETL